MMTKLRIRTLHKSSEQRSSGMQREASNAGYTPVAARYNPHYDRWPSLPAHLPKPSH